MFRGSVALMILQSVGGVKRGELGHGAIARDLGDDRCGGDGGAAGVAIDDGDFQAGEAGLLVAVDEAGVGLDGHARVAEALDGAAHGEEAGAENIVGLDFLGGRDADRPRDLGMTAEKMAQFLAVLDEEELRVVEMPVLEAVGQDDRRGIDRPGPAAAADFIDSGDEGQAFGAQLALECPAKGVAAFARRHISEFLTELTELTEFFQIYGIPNLP